MVVESWTVVDSPKRNLSVHGNNNIILRFSILNPTNQNALVILKTFDSTRHSIIPSRTTTPKPCDTIRYGVISSRQICKSHDMARLFNKIPIKLSQSIIIGIDSTRLDSTPLNFDILN